MQELVILTRHELKSLIKSQIEEVLSENISEKIREATEKKYLTIKDVCDELDVSRRHLQYLRDSEQINYIKNGRKVYFRRKDIDDFFDKNLIRTGNNNEQDT